MFSKYLSHWLIVYFVFWFLGYIFNINIIIKYINPYYTSILLLIGYILLQSYNIFIKKYKYEYSFIFVKLITHLLPLIISYYLLKDNLVIGICNGCQILVNLGIVPSIDGNQREVALVENDTAIYQCRWINVKITNNDSPWLKNIEYMYLPVAHQEGKFIMDKKTQNLLVKNNLIACQYVEQNNQLAKQKFPYNPNGSVLDIAALTNKKGNVLAIMPHPERAYYHFHEPDWQNKKKNSKYADGYKIFQNAKKYFK